MTKKDKLAKMREYANEFIYILIMICFGIFLFFNWLIARTFRNDKRPFIDFIYEASGNTFCKIECKNCGYEEKHMLGTGHSEDVDETFCNELVYCPGCKLPFVKTTVHNNKGGRLYDDVCPKCGKKNKKYKFNSKIKLKCPKCNSENLIITDTKKHWVQ